MGIKTIFSKLFGGGQKNEENDAVKTTSCEIASNASASANAEVKKRPGRQKATPAVPANLKDLEGFVEYVVKALVDYPEEVVISSEVKGDSKLLKIVCRASDRGKIIGKKGKTIIALRSLVAGAAGRMQDRVTVEVIDDVEEVKG